MELVKNIFFNTDKLVANNTVKISYTGTFFQDGSKKVYIKYAFGKDWENSVEKEMTKTELGFQVEIELQNKEIFSFCFKNENDKWDNNNDENYNFEVEQPETSLIVIDENKPSRKLRKTYILSKKIKLAIYKMLIYIPKLITGNYKRKPNQMESGK